MQANMDEKMKKAVARGNSRSPYQLIRNTGPRKLKMSELIMEADVTLTHSKERQLALWTVWLAYNHSGLMAESEPMHMDTSLHPEWR